MRSTFHWILTFLLLDSSCHWWRDSRSVCWLLQCSSDTFQSSCISSQPTGRASCRQSCQRRPSDCHADHVSLMIIIYNMKLLPQGCLRRTPRLRPMRARGPRCTYGILDNTSSFLQGHKLKKNLWEWPAVQSVTASSISRITYIQTERKGEDVTLPGL